jgi:hypothetical protein
MNAEEHVPDELLEQARARLRELEELGAEGDELGDRVEIAVGDFFKGRVRGEATMRTKEGEEITVLALWDEQGSKRFHYLNAALVAELDAVKPEVGDTIVIARGEDRQFETKDGELRTMKRFAISTRSNPDPLPGNDQLGNGEELPFLCLGGNVIRSVPAAVAVTG